MKITLSFFIFLQIMKILVGFPMMRLQPDEVIKLENQLFLTEKLDFDHENIEKVQISERDLVKWQDFSKISLNSQGNCQISVGEEDFQWELRC